MIRLLTMVKKKTKKTHKGRMKGKSQEVRKEQVKNVVFINFIFYNPYLTALLLSSIVVFKL